MLKSLFPLAQAYITDMTDAQLLDQYRPLNIQIPFGTFATDATRFDVIFLNDVFEHMSDPLGVLKLLRSKLAGADSRVLIDTPRQFWIYPATKLVSKRVHEKLLRGTCDTDHQQIWSRRSFNHVVDHAGLRIARYVQVSEFTQPPAYYLDAMKITNPPPTGRPFDVLARPIGGEEQDIGGAAAKVAGHSYTGRPTISNVTWRGES